MADLVPFEPRAEVTSRDLLGARQTVPEGYPEPESEPRGLKEYLRIIRRNIWMILGVTALCTAIAGWLVVSGTPQYRATSVVRLADTRRALTGGEEAGAYDQVLGRETDVLLSQIQILMSRQNVGRVVDLQGLRLVGVTRSQYIPQVGSVQIADGATADTIALDFGETTAVMRADGKAAEGPYGTPLSVAGVTLVVTGRPSVPNATYQLVSRNDAIDALLANFGATPRPKTDVIDLQFVATEPHYAQRVANAMALAFQARNTQGAQQTSHRRRIFLEEQIKQTDRMLSDAMVQYSSFRTGQQVFSSKEKASAQEEGIVNVSIRRADLDAQRRTYKALIAQARRNPENPEAGLRALVSSPGIAANPVIQQLYAQLTELESREDSIVSAGAAPTNPDLISVRGLVSSTMTKLIAAVNNQIQSLDAQIDALDDLKARSTAEISSAPRTETEEARLAAQVRTIQNMSDQLQQEYQKARMSEAIESGQVEIIDLADLPTAPIAEGRRRKLALGVLIGLTVGIVLAVILEGMNSSIRKRSDIERLLQVPGLAVIPRFANAGPGRRLRRSLPAKVGGHRNGKKPSDRVSGLVTVHDMGSLGAEAYRTLRTNLIFSQAVQTLRTLVVTSAAPAEGKTTTAANLAVSFAQQGLRVLIVDCDLRRSRLHKMFGIPREPGLTELMLGQIDQDSVVRETNTPGLYVLPSGQLPPNPAELLGGSKMRDTLTSLSGAFDLVILDTPPLLAASDAAIVSTIADGVVLVVRAGVTEIEAGQQALAQLGAVGARVVGAVLNDPDSKVDKYGGYYKYEYAGD